MRFIVEPGIKQSLLIVLGLKLHDTSPGPRPP